MKKDDVVENVIDELSVLWERNTGFRESLDIAIQALQDVISAKKLIEKANFRHVKMHRADVLDEMFDNNLGEVADSVAEMNNLIYDILEVLDADEQDKSTSN